MNVKLVSITKSCIDNVELSAEELLVYIARVSNPSNQLNKETADKLLGYLIRSKHWSPFDMCNMTVEVTTSKAVAIQILRHWSIKPQEFSQRYAEVADIEPVELRRAASKNRQSSEEVFDPILNNGQNASEAVKDAMDYLMSLYKELIEKEVAKECARMILPLASQTTLYLNGSVRSWIHYMEQRCDVHAQLEHRRVANEIKNIFVAHFPNIAKALNL